MQNLIHYKYSLQLRLLPQQLPVDSFVEWDKAIYAGLFAAIMTFVGEAFAKIIFKDEN